MGGGGVNIVIAGLLIALFTLGVVAALTWMDRGRWR